MPDQIADMLTRIRNATAGRRPRVDVPTSKLKAEIARILKQEGYIWSYDVDTSGKYPQLQVTTKYVDGTPVLTDLKRVSRPGRRQYVGAGEIPRILNGLGISILSTSRGLMTGAQARRQNIGGELLAYVW